MNGTNKDEQAVDCTTWATGRAIALIDAIELKLGRPLDQTETSAVEYLAGFSQVSRVFL
jgi:hypothetical protein